MDAAAVEPIARAMVEISAAVKPGETVVVFYDPAATSGHERGAIGPLDDAPWLISLLQGDGGHLVAGQIDDVDHVSIGIGSDRMPVFSDQQRTTRDRSDLGGRLVRLPLEQRRAPRRGPDRRRSVGVIVDPSRTTAGQRAERNQATQYRPKARVLVHRFHPFPN